MSIFRHFALIASAVLLASCQQSEDIFYSISYPVVRVEVAVTFNEPAVPPKAEQSTDSEQPTAPEVSADPEQPSMQAEEPVNPMIAIITQDVLAKAPIVAGGSYLLDFSQHNGGYLQVIPAPGAEALTGAFVKEPGKNDLRFYYPGHEYTCTLSSYSDTDGVRKVVLTTDFSAYYKQRYPYDQIKQVLRKTYTSTRSN